jgi:4-amino-4-deoxy-L-arabinose transferase-like glycosyltransferase
MKPARYAVAAAWIAIIGTLVYWLAVTPAPVLREQLKAAQFWSLELCVALMLALTAAVARSVWRELTRRDVLRMVCVSAFAVCLTVFAAPRTNRIYYDEQIYQSIGQNLSDVRRAQMCNDGSVEYGRLQCVSGEYNKQPYAYPHLLSLVYRIAGVDARWAFVVNNVVMGLTVAIVYLAALFLFGDRLAALFASLLVALLPQQILWSATAAAEPSASFACALALAAAAYFTVARSTPALVLTAVVTAYAIQFRPESGLIVPVIALVLLQQSRDELRSVRLWWAGALFLALAAVHFAHLFAVRNEGWGTADARLSLDYVAPNFAVNGRFYVADERFPVVVTLFALAGLAVANGKSARSPLLLYFALFFGIDLLFYAGSYNYGADVRYSLMTYPPLVLLAGLGAAHAARWLDTQRLRVPASGAVITALLFQFLWYMPVVRATTEEAWAARTDVRFAESRVLALRGNAYVLTHNPNMFQVWGVNAGQVSIVLNNPSYVDYLVTRYVAGVYFHWNFWCNVQVPEQQALCRKVLASRPATLVGEFRERDQRFALYRFETATKNTVK